MLFCCCFLLLMLLVLLHLLLLLPLLTLLLLLLCCSLLISIRATAGPTQPQAQCGHAGLELHVHTTRVVVRALLLL